MQRIEQLMDYIVKVSIQMVCLFLVTINCPLGIHPPAIIWDLKTIKYAIPQSNTCITRMNLSITWIYWISLMITIYRVITVKEIES